MLRRALALGLLHLPLLPFADLAIGFGLGHGIGLLQAGRQLGAAAHRAVDLFVGELAPLLLGLALVVVPLGFNRAPVHGASFAVQNASFPQAGRRAGHSALGRGPEGLPLARR